MRYIIYKPADVLSIPNHLLCSLEDGFSIFVQTYSILDYLLFNLEVTKFILHQS